MEMPVYILIAEPTVALIEYKANELIAQGYEPVGGMTAHQDNVNACLLMFYQAMWLPAVSRRGYTPT